MAAVGGAVAKVIVVRCVCGAFGFNDGTYNVRDNNGVCSHGGVGADGNGHHFYVAFANPQQQTGAAPQGGNGDNGGTGGQTFVTKEELIELFKATKTTMEADVQKKNVYQLHCVFGEASIIDKREELAATFKRKMGERNDKSNGATSTQEALAVVTTAESKNDMALIRGELMKKVFGCKFPSIKRVMSELFGIGDYDSEMKNNDDIDVNVKRSGESGKAGKADRNDNESKDNSNEEETIVLITNDGKKYEESKREMREESGVFATLTQFEMKQMNSKAFELVSLYLTRKKSKENDYMSRDTMNKYASEIVESVGFGHFYAACVYYEMKSLQEYLVQVLLHYLWTDDNWQSIEIPCTKREEIEKIKKPRLRLKDRFFKQEIISFNKFRKSLLDFAIESCGCDDLELACLCAKAELKLHDELVSFLQPSMIEKIHFDGLNRNEDGWRKDSIEISGKSVNRYSLLLLKLNGLYENDDESKLMNAFIDNGMEYGYIRIESLNIDTKEVDIRILIEIKGNDVTTLTNIISKKWSFVWQPLWFGPRFRFRILEANLSQRQKEEAKAASLQSLLFISEDYQGSVFDWLKYPLIIKEEDINIDTSYNNLEMDVLISILERKIN